MFAKNISEGLLKLFKTEPNAPPVKLFTTFNAFWVCGEYIGSGSSKMPPPW